MPSRLVPRCVQNLFTSNQMTRYKHSEFEDDITSLGSVQLNEGVSSSTTHIRYHTGVSFWDSRTKFEKCLLVLVSVLVLLVLILSLVLSTSSSGSSRIPVVHIGTHSMGESVCLSVECVKSAAQLLSSLDLAADPCNDFYQYACGGWVSENPIPEGKSIWGTFNKLEHQNQLVIKSVLDKDITELKSKAEQKAKTYYESCLDVNETIEALGGKPMLTLLNDIGGWNISGSFNVSTWSLQRLLHVLHNKYNMGGLFSWAVEVDDRNSSRYIITVDQGSLALPTRDSYLNKTANERILSAYLEYMTKTGVLLGGEENSTRKQMMDIIEFETKLAEITQPAEDRRDDEKMYNLMPISDLQQLAPFISWQEYFSDVFKLVRRKITKKEMVVVFAVDYMTNVSLIVKEHMKTEEGKIVLNNYLVWQTVRTLTSCLSKAFRDAYKVLRKALVGSEGGEEPWRSCVADTNNVIGFALGAMFVRHVFHGNSKAQAEDMIKDVKTAFITNLKTLSWMDNETMLAAQDKAEAITDMIGYPNYILDPEQLDENYKDLTVKQDEYFQNNVKASQYNLLKNIERLGQPVNKTRWGMTPPTVNAYYQPSKNQIVFPAGILQSPFYDVNRTTSLNFGAMGVVMGHELTHAFDDQGREYDKDGNLHKWWNNDTILRFKNRTNCFVKQYSKYQVNGRHLNGKQTLGENIADNGGLKAAYHAYLNFMNGKPEELALPGLNLTHHQLFFLSFAQVWCSSSTVEASNLQIEKDLHSPWQFRVIGPLSNSDDFAKEFNCKAGSRMNPIDKCEVW